MQLQYFYYIITWWLSRLGIKNKYSKSNTISSNIVVSVKAQQMYDKRIMQALLMLMSRKRKPVSFRLDELVVEALSKLAKEENASVNRYIESHFFKVAKEKGIISSDTELFGETRGNKS